MSSKLLYLFGSSNINWQYPSDEYLNYITPNGIAEIITREATHQYELGSKVMWDMFSGIGTDAIRFSKCTGKVLCSELNTDTYQCMNTNMDIHNVYNVSTFNEDCSQSYHKTDLVYFDPPWGPQFLSGKMFDFSLVELGSCNVTQLMRKMYEKHDMIIKTPYLCDSVEKVVNETDILRVLTFSQQKVKFYFIKKMNKNNN